MSLEQLTCILDFLEGQPDLALGRISRSKEGRMLAQGLWQECAMKLNRIPSGSAPKTAQQWRLFYNEYKYRLVKKLKNLVSSESATGGSVSLSLTKLTPLEYRLYTILGLDTGKPLREVLCNPFANKSEFVPEPEQELELENDPEPENESEPQKESKPEIEVPLLRNLEELEERSIRATNRLAAAVESLVARLNEPLRMVLDDPSQSEMEQHPRKKRRTEESSESE